MQVLATRTQQIGERQKTIDFWQVLEQKSAFSEGTIASEILFWNQFVNLAISSQLFFSTKSPLEKFFNNIHLSPIQSELDYIEQRVRLISECRRLLANLNQDSVEFAKIENILWCLRFQLYGFGQRLIEDRKVLYGLIALREAGVLGKDKIKEALTKLAKQNPETASAIFEFI